MGLQPTNPKNLENPNPRAGAFTLPSRKSYLHAENIKVCTQAKPIHCRTKPENAEKSTTLKPEQKESVETVGVDIP